MHGENLKLIHNTLCIVNVYILFQAALITSDYTTDD